MLNLEIWGFVIGTAGTLFAVYTYVKQRVIKSASYRIRGYILLGGTEGILPSEVVIHFQDKMISHLKKITVIFWNSGNVTINRSDIIQMDPLCIVMADNTDILKASIVRQSKLTNNATISDCNLNKKEVCFDFDYLEPRQGLNIEILYQGEDNAKITGTMKGIPEGSHNITERENILHRRFSIIIKIVFPLLAAIYVLWFVAIFLPKQIYFPPIMYEHYLPLSVVIAAPMLIYCILYESIEYYYIMSQVMPPKDLDV